MRISVYLRHLSSYLVRIFVHSNDDLHPFLIFQFQLDTFSKISIQSIDSYRNCGGWTTNHSCMTCLYILDENKRKEFELDRKVTKRGEQKWKNREKEEEKR